MKGEIQPLLERGVHLVDHLENVLELKPRPDGLHPQMILLVDHDRERLPAIHHHRRAHALGGVLAGDEVALDQDLLFQRGEILRIDRKCVAHFRQALPPAA